MWPFKNKTKPGAAEYTLPKGWHELSRAQFIDVAHIVCKGELQRVAWTKIIWILSGLKPKDFIRIEEAEHLKHIPELQWVTKFEFTGNESMLPFIMHRFQLCAGPQQGLRNFSFDQFVCAYQQLQAHHKEKDDASLNRLMSILYNRKEFLFEQMEENYLRFATLERNIKNAAYINFLALVNGFAKLYPLSHGSKGVNLLQSALNPWDKLGDELAGDKFGLRANVGITNVHYIFIHLENNEEKRIQHEFNKKKHGNG